MEIRALPLILVMLPICYCLIIFLDYLDERSATKYRNLMSEPVVLEKEPEKEQLSKIARNKVFEYASETFQKAVLEKVAACDVNPTALEKTMSPAQLYKAGNPLWTNQLNVPAIKHFYELEGQLVMQGISSEDYIDEYVRDCKNGMAPNAARKKQQRKYGIH